LILTNDLESFNSLLILLYAQASNIVFIPYLDQDSLDENALADAQVDLKSFNIDSNDGFHDFDEDNLEEAE